MATIALLVINSLTILILLVFVGNYFSHLRSKERELEQKGDKIDNDYHHIVDEALAKERKILEDAAAEAEQILTGAKNISKTTKDDVNAALQTMVVDIQKEALATAQNFTSSYQLSLKQLATQSTADFQNIVKGLEEDLQKQIKDFHETLLPRLEKELEEYKQSRLAQTEKIITQIVQKASQEILNKSLSLEDHKTLVFESLEKAKKEGLFN